MDPEHKERIQGERVGLALVVIGVLGLLAIGYGIARDSDSEPERSGASAIEREGRFKFCEARLRPPPSGLPLSKRDRRNLGNNVMGESVTYSDGIRKVGIHIGYDALDAAEDIDLAEDGSIFVDGRDFTLLQSKPIPDIWAATAQTGFLTPCDEVTVFTTGFGRTEVVSILGTVRIKARGL